MVPSEHREPTRAARGGREPCSGAPAERGGERPDAAASRPLDVVVVALAPPCTCSEATGHSRHLL